MLTYEVPVTVSFFVQAESAAAAGNLVDYWWRLFSGVDVDKSYQMRQEGVIMPQRWSIGEESAPPPAKRQAHDQKVQALMNKHREKFKFDEASIRLIEEAEQEFDNV